MFWKFVKQSQENELNQRSKTTNIYPIILSVTILLQQSQDKEEEKKFLTLRFNAQLEPGPDPIKKIQFKFVLDFATLKILMQNILIKILAQQNPVYLKIFMVSGPGFLSGLEMCC